MIWIISDTHFGHKRLVDDGIRPLFFEDEIIKNIKIYVKPQDMLINLGDFCFNNKGKYVDLYFKCPGKKILVLGNHDTASVKWYLDRFDFVCHSFLLSYFGEDIIFSHRPIVDVNCINVHGHLHDSHRSYELEGILNPEPFHKLVALELTGYKPILLKNILKRDFKCKQ
jgi:calcineurin-like phosphoesterase family protein